MDIDDYQHQADKFRNKDLNRHETLSMLALGVASESGEICEPIKHHLYHGHSIDGVNLRKELGDMLWYISIMAREFGWDMSHIAQINLDKLEKRYGEKFSADASINRVENRPGVSQYASKTSDTVE